MLHLGGGGGEGGVQWSLALSGYVHWVKLYGIQAFDHEILLFR